MRPTRNHFLNNAYARSIRATCLAIADIETSLLLDAAVDRQAATAKLRMLKEELMGLGITENFKTGLAQSAYKDSATMAEYVAGQWLTVIDRVPPRCPLSPRSSWSTAKSRVGQFRPCQAGISRVMPGMPW